MVTQALGSASQFDLRDYLNVVRRRKAVIAVAVLIVFTLSLGMSLRQDDVYQAEARILLQGKDGVVSADRAESAAVATEIQVLESDEVRASVEKEVPGAGRASGSQVGESGVIAVISESTDPQLASRTVNAYVQGYIQFQRDQEIDRSLKAAVKVQERVDQLQREIDDLDRQLATAPLEIARRLESQRRDLSGQQLLLRQRLLELQTERELSTGDARTVTSATVPTNPIRPNPPRDAITGLGIGLALGIALAYLFEYLDDSIKTKEDIERITGPSVPVVVAIPAVPGWKDRSHPELVTRTDPTSKAAESYRSLRTAVHFFGATGRVTSLHVTSATPGEGKSTTLANLGVVMAEAGMQPLLVDADLRRSRLHEFFGLSNDIGLTSLMLDDVTLSRAASTVSGVPGLKVLPSGPLPPNPSELLSWSRFDDVLTTLRAEGNFLLIDSPPVLTVTDSSVLSSSADATLLVVKAGTATGRELRRAVDQLRSVNSTLVGAVLNEAGAEEVNLGYAKAPTTSRTDKKRASKKRDKRPEHVAKKKERRRDRVAKKGEVVKKGEEKKGEEERRPTAVPRV
jgi:capsular exopolysaccharide synthesis family protein